MGSEKQVALILSEAMREVADCRDRLGMIVQGTEETLKRIKDEQADANRVYEGLKKLHIKATAQTRKAERGALDRAKTRQANRPTDIVAQCLGRSLDMLSKAEIAHRTSLDGRTIGVVIGKGLQSGTFVEKDGKYGVSQALAQELSGGSGLAALAAAA